MKPLLPFLLLALVAGLVGGALGQRLLAPGGTLGPAPVASANAPSADAALAARLDRLEGRLAAVERPVLTPSPGAATAPSDLSDAERARLVAALEPAVDARVEAKVAEIVEREGLAGKEPEEAPEPKRRRVTLAQAAGEMGLTQGQEAALRDIYANYEKQLLDILVGEDGDRDAVLRDIETVKNDPSARMRVGQKYLPRVMKKLPDLMSAEMGKQMAIQEALGDAAGKLGAYDIDESHPFGLRDGGFTLSASASVEER